MRDEKPIAGEKQKKKENLLILKKTFISFAPR